tara:strand:- start:7026 stop:7682 length:657 start_codon:yes stop_codon:yes gene_type:complete
VWDSIAETLSNTAFSEWWGLSASTISEYLWLLPVAIAFLVVWIKKKAEEPVKFSTYSFGDMFGLFMLGFVVLVVVAILNDLFDWTDDISKDIARSRGVVDCETRNGGRFVDLPESGRDVFICFNEFEDPIVLNSPFSSVRPAIVISEPFLREYGHLLPGPRGEKWKDYFELVWHIDSGGSDPGAYRRWFLLPIKPKKGQKSMASLKGFQYMQVTVYPK